METIHTLSLPKGEKVKYKGICIDDFFSLVKRMREVQQEIACLPSYVSDDKLEREKYVLQEEVDKLLEQMEV